MVRDEASLHNGYYWAAENLRWLGKHCFQKKWSFNVWASISSIIVVGPCCFYETFTDKGCKTEILQGVVDQFICDMSLNECKEMYFHSDGVPPNATVTAREWQDAVSQGNGLDVRGT